MDRVISTAQYGIMQTPDDIIASNEAKYALDKQDWVFKIVYYPNNIDHRR